jgi:hypothetical protein
MLKGIAGSVNAKAVLAWTKGDKKYHINNLRLSAFHYDDAKIVQANMDTAFINETYDMDDSSIAQGSIQGEAQVSGPLRRTIQVSPHQRNEKLCAA